jgi:hypothetical protein
MTPEKAAAVVEADRNFLARKAALEEQLRLDKLGETPAGEQKFDVVVPPPEPLEKYSKPQLYTEHSCGVCPAWHLTRSRVPIGQCLVAQGVLGATLYRTDLDGCTLPMVDKAKKNAFRA